MIIATSGHVDHGKTLLVHALTGIDTDRLEEEKARGLTIDLGFAYTHREEMTLGFIDVPGHIKFISNMLAGVAAIDFGMLVVAADDGPMPQTLEHLAILDLLGINHGCVALTKIDRIDDARRSAVEQEVRDMLHDTSLADVPIYPVSSVTGEGIDALLSTLWTAARQGKAVSSEGYFRLAIDRCFTVKGSGIVVTGSVFSGAVSVGDELTLSPHDRTVRVRGIHRQNQTSSTGKQGDRCAINISGDVSHDLISRGNWLTGSPALPYSNRIDVNMRLLATETKNLPHWTPVHIHSAAQHVTGRIATLESKSIPPGSRQLVQLILTEPINICYGDRIIIRDQSATRTLGGGTVLDPFSPRRGRAKSQRLDLLRAMTNPIVAERITTMLETNAAGINVQRFKASSNLRHFPFEDFGVIDTAGTLFSRPLIASTQKLLFELIETWHESNPREFGPAELQLISRTQLPEALVRFAIQIMVQKKKLEQRGNKLKLPNYRLEIAGPEKSLWMKVGPMLKKDMLKPPVLHELAKAVNLPPAAVEKLLTNCLKFGLVVRPVKNRFFLPEAIQTLKKISIELAESKEDGKFTVIEFRDRVGIGRNLCIEILEHFDHTGFTRRLADHRIIQDKTR